MIEQAVRRSSRQDGSGQGFAVRRRRPLPRRTRLLRLGLTLAAGVVLGGGAWLLLSAETFAVTRVQSGSYRFTAKAELDSVLSLFLGRNIWTLHRQEVAAALQDLDWVRDLRVTRRLPGTIEVDFREWRPLAVLALPDSGVAAPADSGAVSVAEPVAGPPSPILVLSEDGRVLPFPQDLVLPALPTLVGFLAGPGGGLAVPDSTVAAVPQILELFGAVEDAGLEALCPVDFVVAGPGGYAIVLQERQGTLLVGREDFTARLRRFMFAREHLQPGAEVDLRFADRVTVKSPPEEARKESGLPAGADKVRTH